MSSGRAVSTLGAVTTTMLPGTTAILPTARAAVHEPGRPHVITGDDQSGERSYWTPPGSIFRLDGVEIVATRGDRVRTSARMRTLTSHDLAVDVDKHDFEGERR
jgi:hypothetical protein